MYCLNLDSAEFTHFNASYNRYARAGSGSNKIDLVFTDISLRNLMIAVVSMPVSTMKFVAISLIILVLAMVDDITAYGGGAPQTACAAARPWHTNSETNTSYTPLPASQNPYRFTVNSAEYVPGESLRGECYVRQTWFYQIR